MADKKKSKWKPVWGPHAFNAVVGLHIDGLSDDNNMVKAANHAISCIKCRTVSPIQPCANCGSTRFIFGLSADRQLGLFCVKCKQGYTSVTCACGCVNPISGETIVAENTDGCFIVTAACGDRMAQEVIYLTAFRDQVLLQSLVGRACVKTITQYLRVWPP